MTDGTTGPVTLVVGGGGFLGTAVTAALRARGADVAVPRVPWSNPDAAVAVLADAVRTVRSGPGPWRVVWCAGSGVVATGAQAFAGEQDVLARVLDQSGPDDAAARGTVFFASSAGAVYAGSSTPPFDESTEPHPLAPYGRSKLETEDRFRSWATAVGASLVVARISNLYGPGANTGKPQGLVSQLALAHLEGRPSSIYVPMSTTRDYLYIDDAAAMVADALERSAATTPEAVTKVFASGRAATIDEVVRTVEQAVGAPLDVRDGSDPSAAVQAPDLRFRSTVWPDLDDRAFVPFDEGVRRTVDALRTAHARH